MMSLLQRLREWRESRSEDRAAVEEMRFHIEQETEHNLRRGMTPSEARRAASRAFGGIDRYAEQARDERPGTRLHDFALSYLDWKLGARMLRKYPGLSVIGGLTLAAAIGLGAGWFEATLMTLYPDLPLEDGDRIVRIENWDAEASAVEPRALYDFRDWREQLTTVEQVGAYRLVERNLVTADGASQSIRAAEISPVAFPLARVSPLLGRGLTDADAQAGAPDVAVIGHALWQRTFGGAPDVIGSTVRIGRARATIVGVMPERFGFPRSEQLWLPLRAGVALPLEGAPIGVFARLRAGVSLESAQAELAAFGERRAAENPDTHRHLRPRVLPLAAPAGAGAAREALLINFVAWLLLAAACANVATLMFARTAMRESEIVVRNALGASRLRVMGQLFTESLVLTLSAAAVGLAGVVLVFDYVMEIYAERQLPIPFWYEARLEPITVLYTVLLAVLGAALIGLLPALRATGKDVRAGLTRIGAGGSNMRFGGVWSVVIVVQVAFSVLCLPFGLAAASDALRNQRLRAAFPGDAYLTFRAELDAGDAAADAAGDSATLQARRADVLAELLRRLEAEPGVVRITAAAALPGTYHGLKRLEVERGMEPPALVSTGIDGNHVHVARVDDEYFAAFDMPLVAGRSIHTGDSAADQPGVVINETLARSLGGNPVGVRVRHPAEADGADPGRWYEVIGVVRSPQLNAASPAKEFMFLPAATAGLPYLIVRVGSDAAQFTPRLRQLALQVDPGLRLNDVMTLQEAVRRYDLPTIQVTLMGIGVLLLAILLSAASLYALMSVAVTRRTREIGIRIAIGANPRAVLSALFARAATQIGVGIVIGNALVLLVLSQSVENLQPRAIVLPMLIASAVMALVGLAACYVPGRRALRVPPTQALKQAQ